MIEIIYFFLGAAIGAATNGLWIYYWFVVKRKDEENIGNFGTIVK